jgi:hypothetical protein
VVKPTPERRFDMHTPPELEETENITIVPATQTVEADTQEEGELYLIPLDEFLPDDVVEEETLP